MNILLIGPRACGKTTVGRLVAAQLDLAFVDLDELVQAAFDEPTVQEIWLRHGEAGWRAAELAAVRRVLERDDQVVALGGGAPTVPEARSLLEARQRAGRAVVFYLQTGVETLSRRLTAEAGDRPSLTGGDVAAEVASVLETRRAMYESLADHVIDAGATPEAVASWVVQRSG